jgi:predicted RNase H-like nuclease (RuvC/YqgF family)
VKEKRLSADKTVMALEEVLARLEKNIQSKQEIIKVKYSKNAEFIAQLEKENSSLTHELEVEKKHVEKLEARLERLEEVGDSAEKEIGLMIQQLDSLIIEQKLQ